LFNLSPPEKIGSPQFALKEARYRTSAWSPQGNDDRFSISELLVEISPRARPDHDHRRAPPSRRGRARQYLALHVPTADAVALPRIAATLFKNVHRRVVLALWIGWANRDDNGLAPVSGSVLVRIAGSSLMLLLLLYRQKTRAIVAGLGTVTFWFHAHMISRPRPVLVLWHANFRLGSINCGVALMTMLVVAVSASSAGIFTANPPSDARRKAEAQSLADADELRDLSARILTWPTHDRTLNDLRSLVRAPRCSPRLVLLSVIGWRGSVVRMR